MLNDVKEHQEKPNKKNGLVLGATPKKRRFLEHPLLWYNARASLSNESSAVISRLGNTIYSGVVLSLDEVETVLPHLPPKLARIFQLNSAKEFSDFTSKGFQEKKNDEIKYIICSNDSDVLGLARENGLETCFHSHVNDNTSLHKAIELGRKHPYLMICFQDPTNIPLELVIASLQFTDTKVIKEILAPEAIEDAVVSLSTMEVGADGVVFSPQKHEVLDTFLNKLTAALYKGLEIETGVITKSIPVGMGHRACIDLATLFSKKEGILVGSTSHGGILCCPEVFHLPYMDLRPFRVNAGGVHSYVYNLHNRTNYISELKAGDSIMVVDITGKTRPAVVGRMKIEVRPLRLIEAKFGDVTLNILLQDDWHVRIYSDEGLPLNISELHIGQKVLGYLGTPGRHVGIQVEENILEK